MSEVAEGRKSAQRRQGVVKSDKMDKTVVVETVRRFRHPKYKKFLRKRVNYKAHDPDNTCGVGDTVVIEETRPISKTKRWRVLEITTKAAEV